jgi:hypothetical protein
VPTPTTVRACDNARDKMAHAPHDYVIAGHGQFHCLGHGKNPHEPVPAPQSMLDAVQAAADDAAELPDWPELCHHNFRDENDGLWACLLKPGHEGLHQAGGRSWNDNWEFQPTKQRPGDQVLPSGGGDCVQDRVIADMQESKRVGLERYGSVLKTFNGRQTIQDVHEEVRDLFVYLTQVRMEAEADRDALVHVVRVALVAKKDEDRDLAYQQAAEVAVDAIMGWVVGKRQDAGGFEDQEALSAFLADAWPAYINVQAPDTEASVIEALTHALGDFLDVPEPQEK